MTKMPTGFTTTGNYVAHVRANVDTLSRQELIDFCVWNDPQGTFTDEDCIAEFGSPTSTEDLREIVRDDSHETAMPQDAELGYLNEASEAQGDRLAMFRQEY